MGLATQMDHQMDFLQNQTLFLYLYLIYSRPRDFLSLDFFKKKIIFVIRNFSSSDEKQI
jgi:hypothetical protein